jgi:3',5'-cyclic-AMP phosphodiesterase
MWAETQAKGGGTGSMDSAIQSSSRKRTPATRSAPLLIAQITDIHLGFEAGNPFEMNRTRLDAVLREIAAAKPTPDVIVASGDLTEAGIVDDYRTLRELFDACPVPVLPMVGNHDVRETFCEVFPDVPTHDGFIQYVVDQGPLRLIMLDTLEEGRHGGAFCEVRARWLDDQLRAAGNRPVVVFTHHPPMQTGIDWMTIAAEEPWAARLEGVIARHDNVVAVLAGHIHRPITATWAGTRVSVCPSSAPQVALDLRRIDPASPDGRAMIIAEPPGYGLHLWNGQTLISHYGVADVHPVLASYTQQLQPMVQDFLDERDGVQPPLAQTATA